jgi:anti-sigma factor RsiW
MSCEKYDWKAYALGELTGADAREAEGHTATCEGCREEMAHVRLTLDTLSALREEEVPRRIAFVSDKVFEPKWWQAFLKPSFAAACVIAAAILAHGFMMRPAAADDAAIQARVDQAVTKAVADVEQRNIDAVRNVETKVTAFYSEATGIVRQ